MRLILVAAVSALLLPSAADAQDIKPLVDLRLRYEHVDQDGLPREANAWTLRTRAGVEVTGDHWSLLAEGEATTPLRERFDSGLNGEGSYPIVADPANGELNRLQVQYRGIPNAVVTVGRQRINLGDQRFVGASGWRQNEQTFDAVRIEYGNSEGLSADLAYSWSVRTIWGTDGRGARQQAIGGDNAFATVSHPTVLGTLSGFAFLVDQDEAEVQGHRLSSQTYGVRLAGQRRLSPKAGLSYTLSYAAQSDYHRNPNDYRADYWLVDVGVHLAAFRLGAGYEVLGADGGAALASFQTPLATLHKFQGWADKFLVTPPNGIRDLYASAGYSWKKASGTDLVNAQLTYHRFGSDRLGLHYGNEWDAMISARKGRWTATAKLASYNADKFATDTRKAWLQLDWAL